jgi:hypothetical protein
MPGYRNETLGHGYPTPGPQSPDTQAVMDAIFFLDEPAWQQARTDGTYDLVIVGSGFCGLAVAHRALERDPHTRILMLERGEYFLPEHFQNLPGPFTNTLCDLTETFPWTLSRTTAEGLDGGFLRWQHGMVPFFGGRSVLWSAWCPRPTPEEMLGWPAETIAAAECEFAAAEALLRVQLADQIDAALPVSQQLLLSQQRPVYGALQQRLQTLLERAPSSVDGVYRMQPAPIASNARSVDGIDFQKFSTPGDLLTLVDTQRQRAAAGTGAPFDLVANCIVGRIVHQGGAATALETSRGDVALGSAKLVLALGALPGATIARNAVATPQIGTRYCAHFTSSITARVPKADFDAAGAVEGLQIGAAYVAGTAGDFSHQFHIQISALSDPEPAKNSGIALRYMPDVLTTASLPQLMTSRDHVVLPCATLGEMDCFNPDTWYRANPADPDPTTNSLLQLVEDAGDRATWDAMDRATFETIETCLSPQGPDRVEYWHGTAQAGEWKRERPAPQLYRNTATVHDGSTLYIGAEEEAPVALDYRLRGTTNVYVTGNGLWPRRR